MKKLGVVMMVVLAVCAWSFAALAAALGPENGDFEVTLEPRKGYQGWANEYIFGWKAFSGGTPWVPDGPAHVAVVKTAGAGGQVALKLVGVNEGYVGLRSVHMPVEPNGAYQLTAKAFVKELADPSRVQVWLEFWPKDLKSETSTYRLQYSRATSTMVGSWEDLQVGGMAPADAATCTVLIIIHRSGKAPLVPAEAYVDDVKLESLDL